MCRVSHLLSPLQMLIFKWHIDPVLGFDEVPIRCVESQVTVCNDVVKFVKVIPWLDHSLACMFLYACAKLSCKVCEKLFLATSKWTGEVAVAWAFAMCICFFPNIKWNSTRLNCGLNCFNVTFLSGHLFLFKIVLFVPFNCLFYQIVDKDIHYAKE